MTKIYTCTLNPAIDVYVKLNELKPNIVNRTLEEAYEPNGKGINISLTLKKLGVESETLGFIGGFSGDFIEKSLNELGITTDFINIEGITRINTFINADKEYKIVNKGPFIPKKKLLRLLEQIKNIPSNSILCVSGSTPKGIEEEIFIEIAKTCNEREIKLVLDISSQKLMDCLPYQPFLIKPNVEELGSLFNQVDNNMTEEMILKYCQQLLKKGANHIIISRGEKGSIYVSKTNMYRVSSPDGEVVNTSCSGDAMLGTFIGYYIAMNSSLEDALIKASAAGASTAFSKILSDLTDLEALASQTRLETIY